MRYLLDTSVFIHINVSSDQLSKAQKSILSDPSNEFFLSVASIYEMAIKVRKGKLSFPGSFEETVNRVRRAQKIKLLPIKPSHAENIALIETVGTHGDPFDLLILSQAKAEKLPVLTSDGEFPNYAGVTAIL